MKRTLSIIIIFSLLVGLLVGCGEAGNNNEDIKNNEIIQHGDASSNTEVPNMNVDSADADSSQADGDMFTERDARTEYNESDSIQIQLNGTSAVANSNSVKISGTTITITEEATYIITGTLDDGMIIVNAPDTAKLQIVLNGAEITSKASAALYILEADKVFLTLADGTENILSNGGTFTAIDENNIDAAIFSKQDLTLNGRGSLTVTSPAGHGIVCKDDLVITSGTYIVNSASHGLDANDSVRIAGETGLTIDAGKDGIHCKSTDDASSGFVYIGGGTFEIASGDDAICAEDTLTITDGTINISKSYEGLEALHIAVQGGDINLVASDDGLNAAGGSDGSGMTGGRDGMFGGHGGHDGHGGMGGGMSSSSNGSITISGGNLYVKASGDGLDANGTLTITGGYTVVVGPTQGDTATLDYDKSATITGGTFIGTGAYGMAQTFSASEQGVIAVSVGNQSAGTNITLEDKNRNTIISYAPELPYAVVILSSPDLVSGEIYSITVGANSGEFEAN